MNIKRFMPALAVVAAVVQQSAAKSPGTSALELPAPAVIRFLCSTSLVIWNAALWAWRAGDERVERPLRPDNVHSADGWKEVLEPVVARYRGKVSRIYFRAGAALL